MDDFWLTVLVLFCGGVIGGLLYCASTYLSSVQRASEASQDGWRGNLPFWLANAFIGVGGAWAALLAMLWAKRAPLGRGTEDLLELLATSIVAGYGGNKILPAIAERLTKDLLQKAVAKTEEAAKGAQRSQVEAGRSRDEAEQAGKIAEINAQIAAGGKQSIHQATRHIRTLVEILHASPTYRSAAFTLASVHWQLNDNPAAIDVLQAFIAAKEVENTATDKDTADAYWNLAWYQEQEFKKVGERSYREAAIDSMSQAIRIRPDYKRSLLDISESPDFADLLLDGDAIAKLSL